MNHFMFRGHKVCYVEAGAGEPLLFLHNGGTDHRIWDHQIAHFAGTHHVVALDYLGYGASDKPDIDYTLTLLTDVVEAAVEELRLAPLDLVGHCSGASMALNYTLRHPETVKHLVLFNVATEKTLLAGPLADVYRNFSQDTAARDVYIQQLEANGYPRESTAESLALQLGDDPSPLPLSPERRGVGVRGCAFSEHLHGLYNTKGQLRTLFNNLSQFGTFRPLDEVARPSAFPPVCLIWGKSNRVLPASAGEVFRRRLNPDQFELMEGCGHLLMLEKPAEVNRTIEAFLTRQPAHSRVASGC